MAKRINTDLVLEWTFRALVGVTAFFFVFGLLPLAVTLVYLTWTVILPETF